MSASSRVNRGAISVEYAALAALVGLLIVVALAVVIAAPPRRADRELGEMIARRIACVPRHPVPCGRNPLAVAYGLPLGKVVRSLAPDPTGVAGPGGTILLPVDFRHCRRASCAAPGRDPGLTASGRRVTEFTSIDDQRTTGRSSDISRVALSRAPLSTERPRISGGGVRITYWLYRPEFGWQTIERLAGEAEIAAASHLRLSLDDDPALVPLETLPGRDHYLFPPGEEPPWRWSIPSRPGGRPFD